MIAGKPILDVFNDSILHAQTISIFRLRVVVDKAITSTRDNRDKDFADIVTGPLYAGNARSEIIIWRNLVHLQYHIDFHSAIDVHQFRINLGSL